MRVDGLLGGCILIAVLSAAASASPIKDPQMGLDSGSLSDPITLDTMFSPNGNGGGAFGYFNATGFFIRGLVFGTTILPGLTTDQLAGVFSCNDQSTPGHPNPFFMNCFVNYTPSTGQLKIAFFGTFPEEVPGDPGDDEAGEHEGIPPTPPRCLDTPDAPGCRQVGHFIVTLNNNYTPSPSGTGGWSTTATPGIFLPGGPTFEVLEIDTAPEPGTAGMLCGALIGLAGLAYRRRKRPCANLTNIPS